MHDALVGIALLGLGIALMVLGGNLLVKAAITIADRLGAPPLLVGLTIVAWGTSAPEVAFNLAAAWKGSTDLVFGSVTGSNICNIGVILAICALIRPPAVHSTMVLKEMPLALAFALLMMAFATPWSLGGSAYTRVEGALILVVFAFYTFRTIRAGLRQGPTEPELTKQSEEVERPERSRPMWLAVLMLLAGLTILGVGGTLATGGAGAIARALGMPDAVIAVTIVAIGTTTPELITSLIATRKGQSDLAVGNVIGSCLFNIGFVFSTAVLVHPGAVPEGGWVSLGVMTLLAFLVIPMSVTFDRAIARGEGAILMVIYAALMLYQISLATRPAPAPVPDPAAGAPAVLVAPAGDAPLAPDGSVMPASVGTPSP
jgi:cation:H+ antiporter